MQVQNDRLRSLVNCWPFAVIFAGICALILYFGANNVTGQLAKLVDAIIWYGIILCILAGLVCFVFSMLGMRRSFNELGDLETQIDASGPNRAAIESTFGRLREQKKERPGGISIGPLSDVTEHLLTRLTAMGVGRKAAEAESRKADLQDARELTLQSELSRPCSAAMNTIVAFLLILGILGTLAGVHQVIQDGIQDIGRLEPALRPSQWAVGGTCLLLLLRGIYLLCVNRYVTRLDSVSMTSIHPPKQDTKSNWKAILNSLKGERTLSEFAWKGLEAAQLDQPLKDLQASVQAAGKALPAGRLHPAQSPEQAPPAPAATPATSLKDVAAGIDSFAASGRDAATILRALADKVSPLGDTGDMECALLEQTARERLEAPLPPTAAREFVKGFSGSLVNKAAMDYALKAVSTPNPPEAPAYRPQPTYSGAGRASAPAPAPGKA